MAFMTSASAMERISKARQDYMLAFGADPYMGFPSIEAAIAEYKFSSQVEILSRLLNRENVFISGLAGSGKTTLIKRFIEIMEAEFNGSFEVAITASTGIAASLLGGRTLHSWMGLTPDDTGDFDPKAITTFMMRKRWELELTDVLIIDEVSMMPAWQLTKLDAVLKHFRKSELPFGGIQLILIGDFLQLPPVTQRGSDLDCRFAIETDAWQEADIKNCFMDKVHRATDSRLKNVLAAIVSGKMNDKIKAHLMKRHISRIEEMPDRATTTLFTVNRDVDAFNRAELEKNPHPPKFLVAEESGPRDAVDKLYKETKVPRVLNLKVDAVVMLSANIKTMAGEFLANGTMGRIETISANSILIKLNNGNRTYISKNELKKTEKRVRVTPAGQKIVYEALVASISQFPLKLGYAITVHKSQGSTLDGVVADLSKCFTPGLGYVALSRVRSLDDLVILGITDKAFALDPKSDRASRQVRRAALENRKAFLENLSYYDFMLTSNIARSLVWDPDSGGAAKILERKK